ncbi:MAG TPA: TIGR00341 family protein [Ignavibacteria bacterium]|nr:TIGR00341 family protein [Ignavibacteria bacterium]
MIRKLIYYFDLSKELESPDEIHNSIEKGVIFKGTNLWILVFAIFTASVGLNMNSTAVIIGAMLISPLMGPINGMGYSIATYDFLLFKKSVKNFTFAVITSLIASTIYFSISPVSTAHSELLARTSPTIYDVLIALFGGLAGIFAISSKLKGNVIPGVAIATALMPPLCTAGYGLATFQLNYFFGAFYLFTINTVFIAISSVAASQILKFPIRSNIVESKKKKVNQLITLIILITIVPSIYFGYGLIRQEKFTESVTKFTKNVSLFEGNYLLNYEINPNSRRIKLIYGGSDFSDEQKNSIKERAKLFELSDAEISFQQGLSYTSLTNNISEMDMLKNEIARLKLMLQEKSDQFDSLKGESTVGQNLLKEIKSIYPDISELSFSNTGIYVDTLKTSQPAIVIYIKAKPNSLNPKDKTKINDWLKVKFPQTNLKLFYED